MQEIVVTAARAQLEAADQAGFETAWNEGQAMNWQQAIEYAYVA